MSADPRISVIIPALDEVDNLTAALPALLAEPGVEVLVADGGSTDGSAEEAAALGARLVRGQRGRARQMNAGAGAARAAVLLFLHADTRLPPDFVRPVLEALAVPGVAAGAFTLRYADRVPGLRVIERLANWRSRRFGMPYGDQALFMRADVFRAAGGFPDLPLMEDFEMVRRLRRSGRIAILPQLAVTSGRRWKDRGVLRMTLLNQVIIAAHFAGVSPVTLARWYRGRNRPRRTGAP